LHLWQARAGDATDDSSRAFLAHPWEGGTSAVAKKSKKGKKGKKGKKK
jgi:hypothetical protein